MKQFLGKLMLLCSLLFANVILTACGQDTPFPVYNDVIRKISDHEVVQYDNVQPYFGDRLKRVNSEYYLVAGSVDTVHQWYQNLVADKQLYFVDSQVQTNRHMLLFDFPANFNQKNEVGIIRIDDNSSLLLLYHSIDVNNQVTSNSSWFARTWGWLMGISGPSGYDQLFGLIFSWITPIQFFYQNIYLKPVLNLYLILRSILPWHFFWIIILHSYITSYCFDFIKNIIGGIIMALIPKSTSTDEYSLLPTIRGIVSLLITKFFDFLLVLAIWQTLTAFFDLSSSARMLLTDNHYGWISTQMLQIGLTPPSGEFFGIPLNKPNIIIVPLFIFIIAITNFLILVGICSNINRLIIEKKIPRSQFNEQTLFKLDVMEKAQEDPLEFLQKIFSEALRTATPLAFMPIGVAFFFSFQEVEKLYTNIIYLLRDVDPSAQNHTAARISSFIQNSVKYASILGLCYLCYSTYTQSMNTSLVAPLPETTAINASIVTSTPEDIRITPTYRPNYGEVTTKSLRVRENPNAKGRILSGLTKGQKIQIIGISADNLWLFVEYQTDKFGWVSRDFVTVNDESSLPQLDEQAAQDYVATLANNPITSQKTTNDVNGLYVYPRLLTDIRAISAKSYSFLALRNDGSVVMWGNDACGKGKLPSQSNISTISAGGSFCMALTTDKTLVIWGSAKSPATNPPQTLNIAKISAGYFHALALTEDGQVLAWGDNEFQQCDVPVFTSRVVDIRAGVDSSIALLSDGSAVIWGQNMAAGTYQNVRDIAPAYNHSAILFSDGSVKIAGEMMGAGYEFPSSSDYIAIAADEQAQIAIRRDTTVVGGGYYGSMTVTTPSNLTNIVAIATGINQSLALHSDGSVTQFGETQLTP